MDNRINYKIVLDTETCPLDRDLQNVIPSNMFTYDIGWIVTDKRGTIYKKRSYIVADIFLDEKALMKSAYYADKIPQYWNDIKSGKRGLKTWWNIKKQFYQDISEWRVKEVYAHNARFDCGALNNTERWLTKSKRRFYLPKDVQWCDTLKMSRQVIGTQKAYKNFCIANGYLTKNNRLRFTAEILYRYIIKDNDFIESHTALEDVLIEKEIMRFCFKQHKKMNRFLWDN